MNSFFKSLKTSLLLSLLFLVVYGGCNYLTSLRSGVPAYPFAWERAIPFVPWLVVPYLSIDFFYMAAPFACRTDRERIVLAKRVTAAVLIAAAFFLLVPMRFSFERPHAAGWIGTVFDQFHLLDQPFNEFPSLHIALLVIFWPVYWRRTRGAVRVLVMTWMVLIGLSPVPVFQHHAIDVLGGLVLGVGCLYAIDEAPWRWPVVPNRRIGAYYLLGAIAFVAAGWALRPWGWLLLWPALSAALPAAAYLGLGPGIYRKRGGRLPGSTWLVLGGVLIGQHLSLLYYRRRSAPWHALTEGVWIGRQLSEREAQGAAARGVTAVLDLTSEFTEPPAFRGLRYRCENLLDLTAPPPASIDQAIDFIRTEAARGLVYVHCKAGYSRTAAVAGAYLVAEGKARDADDAIRQMLAARPEMIVRPEAKEAIREFEERNKRRSDEATERRREERSSNER